MGLKPTIKISKNYKFVCPFFKKSLQKPKPKFKMRMLNFSNIQGVE